MCMGRAKDWSLKILGLVSPVRFLVAPLAFLVIFLFNGAIAQLVEQRTGR